MKKIKLFSLSLVLFGNLIYGANLTNKLGNGMNCVRPELKNSKAYSIDRTYNLDIESVFRSFDSKSIKTALSSQDNIVMAQVNQRNSNLIKKYLKDKYNIQTDENGEDSPEANLVFGLFQYGIEKGISEIPEEAMNSQNRTAGPEVGGDPFNCLVGAIGGLIGIGEVRALYNDYSHGVTPGTILRTLRTMVRRVGSIFAIISAVYSFGDCLNWW